MYVKHIIKKTVKWSLIGVSALLLLAAVLFGLVQTGPGKESIRAIAGKALGKDRETRIEIGTIDGFIPFDIRIDHLTFWDSGSQWLRLDGIFIHWSPLRLLGGDFVVDELRVMSAQVNRPPTSKKEKTAGRRDVPPWLKAITRLQLRKFSVETMVLDASLLGERAEFKLEVSIGVSLPDGTWETRVNMERLDRNGAPTTLRALFEGKGTHMTAEALMEEPAGGLVAKSLGIEGPILLSLKGKGPTTSWKGTVIAEGGSLGKLQAELGLSISDKDLRVTSEGHVQIDPAMVPDPLVHWVDQNAPFELQVSIHRKSRLTIDYLKVKSEKASLQVNASVDLETETTNGEFRLRSDDLSPMENLASIKGSGGTVDGHFSGSLLKPETSLNFNIANFQAGDVHVKDVQGHVNVTFIRPINVAPIGIRVQGAGKLGELVFRRGKDLIPEKDVAWILAIDGSPKERLSIEQLKLTGSPASVMLSGWVDTSRHTGSVDANIDVADLSAFSRFVDSPFTGRTRMKAKITGNTGNRSLSARITGEYQPPETFNASLVSLVNRKVGYSGIITYDGQKKIIGSDLLLDTISGTIKGDMTYDLGDRELNGDFQMGIPKLDRFSHVLGKEIQGSVSIMGAIKGPFEKLSIAAQMVGREVRFEKMNLDPLSARLKVAGFTPEIKGQLDFDLFEGPEKFQGVTHFAVSEQHLSLTRLSVRGAGAEITGTLTLDLQHLLIKGKLQGATNDLVPVSALFNQEVKGAAQIDVEVSGSNTGQKIAFDVDSTDVASRGFLAGRVILQGEIDNAFRAPKGLVRFLFQEGKYKRIRVTSLEMNVTGTPKQFYFKSHVKGRDKEDFDLETSGRVSSSAEGRKFLLNRFQGRNGKLPLNLVQPVVVNTRASGLDVEPVMLQLGSGRLEGSGTIGKDAVSLSVQFMDLPLSALPVSIAPNLMGTAKGQIQMRGSSEKPEIMGRLSVIGLGMHLHQTEDFPPGTLEVNADLREGRLLADVTLQGITATPLKAGFELPMVLSFAPFSIALPDGHAVKGDMTGEVDLGRMAEIYALQDQVLNGRMAFNLTIGGHLGDLKLRGGGRIENGFYENVRTGTILKDIEALFEAGDHRIFIKSAQASDGESGKIKAQGWVDFIPDKGFPFLVDLELDEAKPLRRDDVMLIMGGPLKLSGSLKALLLEGQLRITRAEIRIPERLPPDIVQLEVVEINQDGLGSTVNRERPLESNPTQRQDIKLDISLSSSGHIFVEGRGLSSEWKGSLHIKGTSDVPVITGQLSVVRGYVNFLGKRFKLSHGEISFSGASPPSPQIDLLGESSTKDITARIEFTGSMNRPTVKLSSDPELPQDEVLSRLLFGRNLANISPYQAVQLASAVNTLTGGGGFDLLGQTRKMLGVDQLEIKNLEGDKSETAISAGKYLSENVYMEVEKGLGPKGGKGSVVWEITPNLNVETEVGENGDMGGGVNWKWDY